MSQNFLGLRRDELVFFKRVHSFVYGEVRTGRVGVTAGSLQWKDVDIFLVFLVICGFVS